MRCISTSPRAALLVCTLLVLASVAQAIMVNPNTARKWTYRVSGGDLNVTAADTTGLTNDTIAWNVGWGAEGNGLEVLMTYKSPRRSIDNFSWKVSLYSLVQYKPSAADGGIVEEDTLGREYLIKRRTASKWVASNNTATQGGPVTDAAVVADYSQYMSNAAFNGVYNRDVANGYRTFTLRIDNFLGFTVAFGNSFVYSLGSGVSVKPNDLRFGVYIVPGNFPAADPKSSDSFSGIEAGHHLALRAAFTSSLAIVPLHADTVSSSSNAFFAQAKDSHNRFGAFQFMNNLQCSHTQPYNRRVVTSPLSAPVAVSGTALTKNVTWSLLVTERDNVLTDNCAWLPVFKVNAAGSLQPKLAAAALAILAVLALL